MPAEYEIYKDKKGGHCFRLKAGNGETILSSESYASRSGCANGIKSVQKNSGDAKRFEARVAKNGKHYFVLKAANHQVIGRSQMYATESGMKNGIKSVQKNGSTTRMDDLTKKK